MLQAEVVHPVNLSSLAPRTRSDHGLEINAGFSLEGHADVQMGFFVGYVGKRAPLASLYIITKDHHHHHDYHHDHDHRHVHHHYCHRSSIVVLFE